MDTSSKLDFFLMGAKNFNTFFLFFFPLSIPFFGSQFHC